MPHGYMKDKQKHGFPPVETRPEGKLYEWSDMLSLSVKGKGSTLDEAVENATENKRMVEMLVEAFFLHNSYVSVIKKKKNVPE